MAGWVCACLVLTSVPASGLDVPPLTGRVVDHARVLSAETVQRLSEELAEHERKTGNQIAVLIVPSLEGESLEEYSHRVATSWRLGQQGKDNGVLLLIVTGDRRLRIEVGYGLEGVLTDAVSSRIIRHAIVPHFQAKDLSGGVTAGVRAILDVLERGATPEESGRPHPAATDDVWPILLMAVFIGAFIGGPILHGHLKGLGALLSSVISFFLALPAGLAVAVLASVLGVIGAIVFAMLMAGGGPPSRPGRRWRPGDLDPYGWGGGFGGGYTPSDSFSGGGGDFGGGGASGRW